jgi:phosphocarrier protein
MLSVKKAIINEQGMHMRPAQDIVKAVTPLKCDVFIEFSGSRYNAKSTMNLMVACMKCGSEVEIICDGEQEAEALKILTDMFDNGFGE